MELKFDPFVRKPFVVEAIEVTEENLKEIAKLIGRVQKEPNGVRYIQVNKQKIPNITKVYAGYWVTRMNGNNNNLRAYSAKVFGKEFIPSTPTTERLMAETIGDAVVANG